MLIVWTSFAQGNAEARPRPSTPACCVAGMQRVCRQTGHVHAARSSHAEHCDYKGLFPHSACSKKHVAPMPLLLGT